MYAPPGYVLFVRQGMLMAQPFDASSLRLTGEAFPLGEKTGWELFGLGGFSVSRTGVLVYNARGGNTRLAWWTRDGRPLATVGDLAGYSQISLSPDDKRVAAQSGGDIWVIELERAMASRLTFAAADDMDPIWSPDGREVVFCSARKRGIDLFQKLVGSGEERTLLESDDWKFPEDWSRDGRFIVFVSFGGKTVYLLPMSGERKPVRVLDVPFYQNEFHFSPDGRWMAFNSNESGRWEVYVASLPDFGDKRQVSSTGGVQALWRKDGRELFYLGLDGKLMTVDVRPGPPLETSVPRALFQTRVNVVPWLDQYAATADGQRFLIIEPTDEASGINVVVNWTAAVRK
jgi:dipeptidyl aminopeptidase/acylaminoacyl peptidase